MTVAVDEASWRPQGTRFSVVGPVMRADGDIALACGCRIKPFRKMGSTLAEMHFRGAVHNALATDRLGGTDDLAVLGTHP